AIRSFSCIRRSCHAAGLAVLGVCGGCRATVARMDATTDVKKAYRLLTRAFAARAAGQRLTRLLQTEEPHPAQRSRLAVYFADTDVNMYQIRQWYRPLQAIADRFPVLVIARAPRGAEALLEDGALPVAFVPEIGQLEALLAE